MKSEIESKRRSLLQPYRDALGRYLAQGRGGKLQPALRLGKRAVALGLETIDLAHIHEQALIDEVVSVSGSAARERIIKRARTFFAEATIPMEETHRAALESNAALSRLNKELSHRSQNLSTSNSKLKEEVAKRKAVERTLRQSEKQTARILAHSERLQEQLRLLSRRILSTQEEERKRISRELHDVIAQALTGIHVHLATLKKDVTTNTKGLTRNIARTEKLVEKSVNTVHQFALDLRPAVLDDLGLIPALHSFMKGFAEKTGIRVNLAAFAGEESLSGANRTALYRVAQEALNNVARHAQASRVDVRLQKLPKAVRMKIKDNGLSFDVDKVYHAGKRKRLGLLGMCERMEMVGGSFSVESSPDTGTTIKVQVPTSTSAKGRVGS